MDHSSVQNFKREKWNTIKCRLCHTAQRLLPCQLQHSGSNNKTARPSTNVVAQVRKINSWIISFCFRHKWQQKIHSEVSRGPSIAAFISFWFFKKNWQNKAKFASLAFVICITDTEAQKCASHLHSAKCIGLYYSDSRTVQAFQLTICSNSTYSICCGFVVQLVVQQIHNKSTTSPNVYNKSTTNRKL